MKRSSKLHSNTGCDWSFLFRNVAIFYDLLTIARQVFSIQVTKSISYVRFVRTAIMLCFGFRNFRRFILRIFLIELAVF